MAVNIWKPRLKQFDYALSIDFVDELDFYLTKEDMYKLIEKLKEIDDEAE